MPESSDARARRPDDVPANEIVKALRGADFPASRERLVEKARQNRAPDTVLQAIRNLPSREFDSPVDVERAYGRQQ